MGKLLVKPGVDFGTTLAASGARILEVLKALVAGYDFDLTIITTYPGTPYYDLAVPHATPIILVRRSISAQMTSPPCRNAACWPNCSATCIGSTGASTPSWRTRTARMSTFTSSGARARPIRCSTTSRLFDPVNWIITGTVFAVVDCQLP